MSVVLLVVVVVVAMIMVMILLLLLISPAAAWLGARNPETQKHRQDVGETEEEPQVGESPSLHWGGETARAD